MTTKTKAKTPFTNTEEYPNREAWLTARRKGIGGSDAPILLGQVPKKGPPDVWLAKVDGAEGDAPTERMKWGIRQEDGIRRGYSEDSGRTVFAPSTPYTIIRRTEIPWLCYSPDGTQYDDAFEGPGVLQIKNVAVDQRSNWLDGPPANYLCQLQHEMMVGGSTWGTLMVLFGGNEGAWWDVEANPTFQASMLEVERDFWRYVEEEKCPPVDWQLPSALATLKRLYPASDGQTIELTGDYWCNRLNELTELDELAKRYKEEADAIRADFQQAMKEAEAATVEDGRRVTWKTQKRAAYEVQAGDFRVFRFPKK
jgi:putative phage-type endonuclease